jgi:RNA polymerase sigma-70 factor (ECF subfamily)
MQSNLSDLSTGATAVTACRPVDQKQPTATPAEALEESRLSSARAGETGAFRDLVRAHQGPVYSLALRLLGVREDAQELAQDVFMLLHRHLADLSSASHLRFWLRKTACHRAIDRLRRRPRVALLPLDDVPDIEALGEEDDPLIEQWLQQLIARLPATPRAVILLRYQEDLDPPEIAMTLGLPLNTVKSHLRRSLALLRSRCRGKSWDGTEERFA